MADKEEQLKQIQERIKDSYFYDQDNVKRFNQFKNFVFNTAISDEEIDKLQMLQKPNLEFNILEAMVNRLLGEFASQSPSLSVRAADGLPSVLRSKALLKQMEVVEGIIRNIFFGGKNDSLKSHLYRDQIAGGFAVARVGTEYVNPRSFEQNIVVTKAFDATLCGFDPMARDSHKGDGDYCFEIVPMTRTEFEVKFGKDTTKDFKFTRSASEFNWSYSETNQDIALLVYYYDKVKRDTKIVKLSNGHVVTKKHYLGLKDLWERQGFIEQIPLVIDERDTVLESIDRFLVCEDKILGKNITDYRYLPLVFFDGNSEIIKKEPKSPSKQMTRPYVYHALGVQKMKNFCGQTIGAEIEGMIQHKWKVALESVPEKYLEAYTNVQQEQVLFYNAFDDKNPDKVLPPPMEVARVPTPPLVMDMFLGADRVTQTILGAYDAELGISGGDISGKAIQQGNLSSNAAASPYLENFINGLNRVGQIIIDLIPKYYVTPRSVPVVRANGERDYVAINGFKSKFDEQDENQDPEEAENIKEDKKQEDAISMHYEPNTMQIQVEAGVNSEIEKQMSLELMIRLMKESPLFGQFMNTVGLIPLLNNVSIRGIEQLKMEAEKFMKNLRAQQEAQAGQPDPETELVQGTLKVEQAKVMQRHAEAEMKAEQAERENQRKAADDAASRAIEKEKVDMEFIKMMAEFELADRKELIEKEKISMQQSQAALDNLMTVNEQIMAQEQVERQQEEMAKEAEAAQAAQQEQMPPME